MQPRRIISHKLAFPDATALTESYKNGSTTPEEVVKEYIDRLTIFQPSLNGAVKIFAEQAMEEAKNPKPGLLSGVPISVKETFGMEGETITAGSKIGEHYPCEKDSHVVAALKAAGAIIVARSNVPEFGMFPETDNLLYGKTNSPLNLDHTAGGSSGGEGALVGSGSVVLGVGSDIGGSIRYPAAFCGIVGFKPSSDGVDKSGTYPFKSGFSESMLAIGPLTRSVRDAKLVHNVIGKKPIQDIEVNFKDIKLYYPQVYRKTLKDADIAVAMGNSQALLIEAGMQKTHADFADAGQIYLDFATMIKADFEEAMHSSLTHKEKKRGRYNILKEAYAQLTGKPNISPFLFTMLVGMRILRPSTKEVTAAIKRIEAGREKYHELLGDNGLLLLPSVGALAPEHSKFVAQLRTPGVVEAMKPTVFTNVLDLPCIALPAWKSQDSSTSLVPSLMLACKPGREDMLFAVAEWLESRI